jgi:hypothetical protein
METEMVLTLEMLDRIERRLSEWGGAFSLTTEEKDALIAAARAHLEGEGRYLELARQAQGVPTFFQPPQQREDEPDEQIWSPEGGSYTTKPPAPSSTVERCFTCGEPLTDVKGQLCKPKPSPDAGLVERLRCNTKGPPFHGNRSIREEAAGALEAKDAEIERLKKAYPFHAWSKQKEEAQAEIARLRAFIWDNGLAALESEYHAALQGGDAGRAGRRKP